MITRYKNTLRQFAVILVTTLLIGCGGGGESTQAAEPTPPEPPPVTPPTEQPQDDTWQSEQDLVSFINRASFGATPDDLSLHNTTTASSWFAQQLSVQPTYLMPALAEYTRPEDVNDASIFYINSTSFAFWKHAITANDQLRQRVAFALSEILVTSTNSGDFLAETPEAMASYQDILIKHAFGNYRALLDDVTYSPAMGFYLTYLGNLKGDEETGRTPDENYARELLQLFTIGVVELNLDGSEKLDAQGKPIETYTNADIQGLARVFTGLNFNNQAIEESISLAASTPMSAFDEDHSLKEKSFLGQTIAEDTYTQESITQALDIIFDHANVAPFIGKQLIQRLVTSNPSAEYVSRVATAFESGTYSLPDGTSIGENRRGDLAATVAAILFDDEALNLNPATGGKIREPIVRFTQWARAFEVQNIWPHFVFQLWDTSSATLLAQHPYRSPSVFNFFRPGYISPGSVSGENNLVAPELQITNATSIPGYINFMTYFIFGVQENIDLERVEEILEVEGVNFDPEDAPISFQVDYGDQLDIAEDASELVAQLNLLLTANTLTESTTARIVSTISQIAEPQSRVNVAILMVMTSADYLVQL